MKKIITPILLLIVIGLVSLFSCNKSYIPASPALSLSQLFTGLRYTPQSLNVTAGKDTVVFGANGTMLHFYANSFKDASGNIITSDTVHLQLVEMYKPVDMIFNRAITCTPDGQLLQSGGEINIIATMNGQEVFANKYGIGFDQPSATSIPMQLYYGSNNNSDSLTTWTSGNNNIPGTASTGTIPDTIYSNKLHYTYQFYLFDSCPAFHLVSCDANYAADMPKTMVRVILPDGTFNPSNTQLYLVIPGINCVISTAGFSNGFVYNSSANTMEFVGEGSTIYVLPVGMNYDLVVISNKNGNYYYSETSGVATSSPMIIPVSMTSETKTDLLAGLQGL